LPNSERTEIFTGEEATTTVILQVFSDSRHKCESCIDSTSPSVSIDVFKRAIEDARRRGISFKFLTEITRNNLYYCKLLSIGSELRHLDGIKGNFSIFDDKVYLASAILKESQPVSQLIYSNVKTFVEQQQYLFETLWNRAIPAEIRIREIEEDTILGITEVIQVPSKIHALFINLIKSVKEEVFLVLPTINALYREERLGIIQSLQEAALDRNINVRILTPTDGIVEKKVGTITALAQGQKFDFRPIKTTSGATVTTATIGLLIERNL